MKAVVNSVVGYRACAATWATRASFCMLSMVAVGHAAAQAVPDVTARFVDVSAQTLPDGRFHALIQAEVPSTGYVLQIDEVEWTGSAVNVDVSAFRPDIVDQPAITTLVHPLSIENLPAGTYPIRLSGDEVTVTVPEQRRLRQPLPAQIWPASPNALDTLWLVFEPLEACATYELIRFTPSTERGSGLVVIESQPAACPDVDAPPSMQAVRLGQAPAGEYVLDLRIQRDANTETAHSDGQIALQVAHGLNERVGGAWYDPTQPGQGLDIHLTHSGEVLLYWFTFDLDGNPAWIQAQGHPNNRAFPLMAQVVTGGRFPPRMDPAQIRHHDWGQIWLDFDSCGQAQMSWSTGYPGFDDGEMTLSRLTSSAGPGCDAPPPASALVPTWYQGEGTFFRLPDAG